MQGENSFPCLFQFLETTLQFMNIAPYISEPATRHQILLMLLSLSDHSQKVFSTSKLLSCVWLFVTPCIIQPMKFSRPEYWRVAVPFFRGSSQPRDRTQVSHIAADSLSAEPPWKPFLRTYVIRLSPLDNPGLYLCLKIHNLHESAEFLLPCQEAQSHVPGLGWGHIWGYHSSYHTSQCTTTTTYGLEFDL